MTSFRLLVLLAYWASAAAWAVDRPRVAIIIDDVGYRLIEDRRVLALPREVAVSVLPFSPHGKRIAAQAAMQQRLVMLHLPMQSMGQTAIADRGMLNLDSTRDALGATLAASLASVPAARGVNNHMGSLLTRHPGHMRWLMEALACYRDMFFVDSFTTHHSVALAEARRQFVPSARRDVFLDDDTRPEAIEAEFERMIGIAEKRGQALAIGHPLPETLAVLEALLESLPGRGIDLVSPDALLSVMQAPGFSSAD